MLNSIQAFFREFIAPEANDQHTKESALPLATAALLIEMMRMDDQVTSDERMAIGQALQKEFGLSAEQIETLMQLAEQEARDAHDYYQFTSLINKSCDHAQKVRIIENLWHVAMIDGHLDAHELHLMRKLADLLYIGHADYVAAKMKARISAGLPAE